MKIRFYHWWVYKLFYRVWNPIFANDHARARFFIERFTLWLEAHEAKAKEAK